MPSVLDLYVRMGMYFCGWNIYSSVTLFDSPDLVLWNNAPTSAYTPDNIKIFLILERARTVLLDLLVFLKLCDPNKKLPPARILECISDRYYESICMIIVMFLAWYIYSASGCVEKKSINWDTADLVSYFDFDWTSNNVPSATIMVWSIAIA